MLEYDMRRQHFDQSTCKLIPIFFAHDLCHNRSTIFKIVFDKVLIRILFCRECYLIRECYLTRVFELENFLLYNDMFNSLSNNKSLDRSKLKGFADDKINVTQKLKFIL